MDPSTSNNANSNNVLQAASANGSFKTFGKAIERAGLTEKLNGAGPFTIFAPTDAAFEKLPAGRLDTLFKPENKQELVSLMNGHVFNGRKSVADFGKLQSAQMASGQSLPIKLDDGKVSIGGGLVSKPDIGSRNGVLHGIDAVNVPTKQ
jgi:uncharacterized surface protein with fasciclin (FAS1) repeats